MGDRLWSTRFRPVLGTAIPLLANLLGGSLLEELVAEHIIEEHHYDELSDSPISHSNIATARKLYIVLRRKPKPSFANFCGVLLKLRGGAGQDLYHLLTVTPRRSQQLVRTTLSWRSQQLVRKRGLTTWHKKCLNHHFPKRERLKTLANNRNKLKQGEKLLFKPTRRSQQLGRTTLSWRSQQLVRKRGPTTWHKKCLNHHFPKRERLKTLANNRNKLKQGEKLLFKPTRRSQQLGRTMPSRRSQQLVRTAPSSRSGASSSDDKVTVFVDVTKGLEERYKLHEDSFVTALKGYLKEAIPQRVRIVKHFPPTLRERNTLRLEVAKFVQISILFPNINRQRFKQEENDFVEYITRIMNISKSDLELCIKDGSCIVNMTVPGAAFIDLMRHLGDCGILSVVCRIDAGALISFGALPWATIGKRQVFHLSQSKLHLVTLLGRLMRDVFTSIFDRVQRRDKSAEWNRKVTSSQLTLDSICVRPFSTVL